ncbi:palmitoyltransferase akr1 [Tulasnella sp. 403]|nr:palmitoyltransferase akr1 [Tulasnella sp. 403]
MSHWNDIPSTVGNATRGSDPATLGVPSKASAAAGLSTHLATGTGAGATDPTRTVTHDEPVNIFLAAQRGDVDTIRNLIDSGKATAQDRDDQNVTPLHWAAINAQLAACKYLLEQGAEVDALGGDLLATPMQWAAVRIFSPDTLLRHVDLDPASVQRNGFLYIIDLLIAHNADPTIADSQGYNTLHLVTHSSTVMPLLYLLHLCPISPDVPDTSGHTSLMWAAYQGDAISVDILLKAGASPLKKDDAGLTALHWAVVRGNKWCIRKLIEAGADINARDDAGKTPKDMAVELKSLGPWKRALEEGGITEDGRKIQGPLSERNTKIAILLLPTCFFYFIFTTLSFLPWFTGVPLAAAEFFALHHISTRVLLNHKNYTENVTSSPYFAAIIGGSMFWVGEAWISKLMPDFSTPAPPTPSGEPQLLSTSPPIPGTSAAESDNATCVFPDAFCAAVRRDGFLVSLAAWATLQLTWTVVLLASQLWQIARQMTTLEVSNLGRYGFMGGKGGSSLATQQGHQHVQGAGDEDGHNHGHHQHARKTGGFLLTVLGFDRFTRGKAADGLAKAANAPNPFDLGWIGNCKDFWTKGKELGVEYETLYDVPYEGFREAKRRRVQDEEDDGFGGGKRNSGVFARTMMMGRNLTGLGNSRGGGRGGYGGYEPVSAGAEDV